MRRFSIVFFLVCAALPLVDPFLPPQFQFAALMRPVFLFAVLGLGLNIVTGLTGLLNLGVAAFMAIGAYVYGICSADVFPFQLGFWWSTALAVAMGGIAGLLLSLPTLRLRGDYLAIVTLGFGEIIQDTLRNLESITKGATGINPLPGPSLFGMTFSTTDYRGSYYLFLVVLMVVFLLNRNLLRSRFGRALLSVREDELAAQCMGIRTVRLKILAFSLGAMCAALAGALWASFLGSTGEPGNYDFQISVIALCIVIVGGLGSLEGVLLGAVIMMGFNSIILVKLNEVLQSAGVAGTAGVMSVPSNWKYLIFGLALILVMRYRPRGLLPARGQ